MPTLTQFVKNLDSTKFSHPWKSNEKNLDCADFDYVTCTRDCGFQRRASCVIAYTVPLTLSIKRALSLFMIVCSCESKEGCGEDFLRKNFQDAFFCCELRLQLVISH